MNLKKWKFKESNKMMDGNPTLEYEVGDDSFFFGFDAHSREYFIELVTDNPMSDDSYQYSNKTMEKVLQMTKKRVKSQPSVDELELLTGYVDIKFG